MNHSEIRKFLLSHFFQKGFRSKKSFFCSFWLIFYPLDPDSRIRIFLRIRIQEGKILRIQRIRILSTAWNLHRIKNVEDTVVFLTRKRVYFCEVFHCKECASHFCSEPANKNKVKKHCYLIHTWSDKTFNGMVVNRTLPSLQEWSIKITLTVPLWNNI